MINHKRYPFQNKILTYEQIESSVKGLHNLGKKIIMVSGCYDIVHLGHARFLFDAKKHGDILIVSVGSDKTLRQLKGPSRPVMDEQYRASMLASLIPVDYVVIDEEDTIMPYRINFEKLLSIIKPEYFAVNNNDKSIEIKRDLVARYGTKLIIIDVISTAITSTTEIIDKIKNL